MKVNTAILESDSFQNINAAKNIEMSDLFTAKKLTLETRSSIVWQSSGYFGKKNQINNQSTEQLQSSLTTPIISFTNLNSPKAINM